MIQTAALQMIPGIKPEHCRTPEIMADAAYQVLIADAKTTTGNFFIDDEVLSEQALPTWAGIRSFPEVSSWCPTCSCSRLVNWRNALLSLLAL